MVKRELIKPRGDARYIRRDDKGRIKESDASATTGLRRSRGGSGCVAGPK